MNRRRRILANRLLLSSLVITCFLALTSCTSDASSSRIGREIGKVLKANESEQSSVINLARVVPGKWTHALVVCRGASASQISSAIGRTWSGPDPVDGNFLAMLVFYNRNQVTSYFQAGLDSESVDHWYFIPCPISNSYRQVAPVILSRESSKLPFVEDRSLGSPRLYFWYVTADALASLGQRQPTK